MPTPSVDNRAEFIRTLAFSSSVPEGATVNVYGRSEDFDASGGDASMRIRDPGGEQGVWLAGVDRRDLDLTVKVRADRAPSGGDEYVYLVARQSAPDTYYLGRLRAAPTGDSWLQAARARDGATELIGEEVRVDPAVEITAGVWIRLSVSGVVPTTLRLKAWQHGQPEPAEWAFAAADQEDLYQPGAVGVRMYLSRRATNAPVSFGISDLRVEPATPVPSSVAVTTAESAGVEVSGARSPSGEQPASPDAVVGRFYALLEQGLPLEAASLWTPRLKMVFPPDEFITQRFKQTRQLELQRSEVVSIDERLGRATVSIELREVLESPPFERQYRGTWDLVQVAEGWRLDQPDLQLEPGP